MSVSVSVEETEISLCFAAQLWCCLLELFEETEPRTNIGKKNDGITMLLSVPERSSKPERSAYHLITLSQRSFRDNERDSDRLVVLA